MSFGPWNSAENNYSIGQINIGSNPLSKLEVASCLNLFDYAKFSWWYDAPYSPQKYNPKVYLGTVQSVAYQWIYDRDSARENPSEPLQKSGSWPE